MSKFVIINCFYYICGNSQLVLQEETYKKVCIYLHGIGYVKIFILQTFDETFIFVFLSV